MEVKRTHLSKRDRQKMMFRNAIMNGLIDKKSLPHPLTRKQAAQARVLGAELVERATRDVETPF